MTRVALALLLMFSPVAFAVGRVDAAGQRCTRSGDHRVPPARIRVFISHRRGSSIPARVVTLPFRTYVSRVMNGGAWPAHKPLESLKVGAVAIKQYAWWHVLHHQPGYSWRGRCYDIRDGDQLYRAPFRSHSRVWRAISATWAVSVRKRGRFIRTGWSGGRIDDGWHLGEDTVTRLARRGWGYQRILRRLLAPVELRR